MKKIRLPAALLCQAGNPEFLRYKNGFFMKKTEYFILK
jgi:hypothetical protein